MVVVPSGICCEEVTKYRIISDYNPVSVWKETLCFNRTLTQTIVQNATLKWLHNQELNALERPEFNVSENLCSPPNLFEIAQICQEEWTNISQYRCVKLQLELKSNMDGSKYWSEGWILVYFFVLSLSFGSQYINSFYPFKCLAYCVIKSILNLGCNVEVDKYIWQGS